MIELETTARINAVDGQMAKINLVWDYQQPYAINMSITFEDKEIKGWLLGRDQLRQAMFSNWPSGTMNIIIIKFGATVRVYLKNEKQKCCLDFDFIELEHFLRRTYRKVSIEKEQQYIRDEIDKWTSS